jgi:hypothetical protein
VTGCKRRSWAWPGLRAMVFGVGVWRSGNCKIHSCPWAFLKDFRPN